MPTTMEEGRNILSIVLDKLPRKAARQLLRQLHFDVGLHSGNPSLRESLRTMAAMLAYDPNAGTEANVKELRPFEPFPVWFVFPDPSLDSLLRKQGDDPERFPP